eukprot:SAG22_NODE_503_length_9694_cov_13.573736_6_plen_274_part_00
MAGHSALIQTTELDIGGGARVDVGELIGRGGSGVVHRGLLHRADGTESAVAVKKLGAAATAKDREKFLKEIRKSVLIAEQCEGVVKTLGALEHDGETCLIMQLYDGSLADLLEGGQLPVEQSLRYGVQVARALASVHRQGHAVLDLKPGNLLFDGGSLYIGDFGISQVAEVTMTTMATNAGGAGTPAYMAPEQHDRRSFGDPGPAADVGVRLRAAPHADRPTAVGWAAADGDTDGGRDAEGVSGGPVRAAAAAAVGCPPGGLLRDRAGCAAGF